MKKLIRALSVSTLLVLAACGSENENTDEANGNNAAADASEEVENSTTNEENDVTEESDNSIDEKNEEPEGIENPSYEIALVDDSNIGDVTIRPNYWVVPDDILHFDNDALENIAEEVTEIAKEDEDFNALMIYFIDDERQANQGYTLGRAEYSPNGEWSQAVDISSGNYSDHEFVFDYGSIAGNGLPIDPDSQLSEEELDMYFYWNDILYVETDNEDEAIQMTADEFDVSLEEADEAIRKGALR